MQTSEANQEINAELRRSAQLRSLSGPNRYQLRILRQFYEDLQASRLTYEDGVRIAATLINRLGRESGDAAGAWATANLCKVI